MRLDVRQWHKRRLLWPGYSGIWSWSNLHTGEHTGSVGFRIEQGAAVLNYTLSGEPQIQRVPILHTPCHYGNTRPWFGCPQCQARVAVIYRRHCGFYCRKCAQVAYHSQSEGDIGRAWRRQKKAEAKLGLDLQRPKGMHHMTHARLLSIILASEALRDDALCRFILRYGLAP